MLYVHRTWAHASYRHSFIFTAIDYTGSDKRHPRVTLRSTVISAFTAAFRGVTALAAPSGHVSFLAGGVPGGLRVEVHLGTFTSRSSAADPAACGANVTGF